MRVRLTGRRTHLQLAGHESESERIGIFQVSVLHNFVHLLFGVAGLAMARTWGGARSYLLGGGAVYGVLFVYGMVAVGMLAASTPSRRTSGTRAASPVRSTCRASGSAAAGSATAR